jgi:hypothetical protein
MSKILYVVRHRKTEDQYPEAALTADGKVGALLTGALAYAGIERIVASFQARWIPYNVLLIAPTAGRH